MDADDYLKGETRIYIGPCDPIEAMVRKQMAEYRAKRGMTPAHVPNGTPAQIISFADFRKTQWEAES